MNLWLLLKRPPWRTVVPGVGLSLALWCGYLLWSPGLDFRDGRYDRGQNALWLSHGWLGADDWFVRNGKTNEFTRYRDPKSLSALAGKLRRQHITDVFPHLCPAEPDGRLPAVDDMQAERFLDSIRQKGLKKMERQHVHLSAETVVTVQVGARHGKPALLIIHAGDVHRAGHVFFRSANGVWLVDHVPPQFIAFPAVNPLMNV